MLERCASLYCECQCAAQCDPYSAIYVIFSTRVDALKARLTLPLISELAHALCFQFSCAACASTPRFLAGIVHMEAATKDTSLCELHTYSAPVIQIESERSQSQSESGPKRLFLDAVICCEQQLRLDFATWRTPFAQIKDGPNWNKKKWNPSC